MPGLIRWRRKDLSYPRRVLFQVARRLLRCNGRRVGGDRRWLPITSRRQTIAKNGPGVALNRPQDTERYNAKNSIVRRAIKCSCLDSKTKWATLAVSFSFGSLSSPAVLSFSLALSIFLFLRSRSSPRHLVVNSGGLAATDHPWSYGNCGRSDPFFQG